jgi:RNA polymerase sigma factor (sigma-70 family)
MSDQRQRHTLTRRVQPTADQVDCSLLDAARHGDSDAFWTLWQRHAATLFALCLREMHGNRADAEDALELAMMKALVKLPVFASQIASARAWLIQLTRNVCRDVHRERARDIRATAHLKALSARQWLGGHDGDTATDGASPEPECDPASLINRLSPRLREALMLRVVEQMAYKDIAMRLRLSCPAARKRVQQARALLRALRETSSEVEECSKRPTAHKERPRQPAKKVTTVPRIVRVQLRSGLQRDIEIELNDQPCREIQKITTLRAYVRRHPAGWKLRLKLADLLYATGAWTEAAECYEQVLKKRPGLTAVSKKLERILAVIAGEDEAVIRRHEP